MSPCDVGDFLAYQTRPEVLQFTPVEPLSVERAQRFLESQSKTILTETGGYLAFAIPHLADDRVIGEVSIQVFSDPQDRRGAVGWSLHPDYQGRGYATEAARALFDYAFHTLRLHRLTSVCDVRNTASARLMERLGMRREGQLRRSRFFAGAWQDEFLYAVLSEEWQRH